MTQLNIRIDENVKHKAEEVCKSEGITLSSIINMLLKKIGDDKSIPYSILSHNSNNKVKDALLVYPLVENGTISHGKAAEIIGMSKWEYIELLADIGIPYFTQNIKEVEEDVENLKELLNKK